MPDKKRVPWKFEQGLYDYRKGYLVDINKMKSMLKGSLNKRGVCLVRLERGYLGRHMPSSLPQVARAPTQI